MTTEDRFARLNGIDVRYRIEGSGPWLVFSHSLACDLHMWDEQAAAFRDRFTVLRYDTRGHGRSQAGGDTFTLAQLATDAAALVDHVGAPPVHWVGLSMGGMIGMTLALARPECIASLTVADSTSHRPPGERATWQGRIDTALGGGMEAVVDATLARWFTPGYRARRPDTMARIGAMIRGTSVDGFVGCCRAISVIDITAQLHAIRRPMLVLVGAEDHGTPAAMSRTIHEHVSGSEMHVIPDASHICNVEQPAIFDALLGGFLQRATGA
jgi:3-oxoadipate enol-lactonase